MVSFDSFFRACETGAGEVIRAFQIVRSWASEHRRDQHPPRKSRRSKSPIALSATTPLTASRPPAPPPPAAIEPLLVRKRKSSGSSSPMSRAKRQNCGYYKTTSSPWASELWEQRHSSDLRTKLEDTRGRDARMTKWKGKRTNRQPLRTRCVWNPFKYDRSPSPPKVAQAPAPRVRFSHHHCPIYPDQFHQDIYYHAPDSWTYKSPRLGRTMPKEKEASSHNNIDETTLQATVFIPVKPAEKENVPRTNDGTDSEPAENMEGEEDSYWDEEDNRAFRKLLRSRPDSIDEDGYRIPIDGILSPEAKLWNEEHRKHLLKEAAQEQQTPSRPPKSGTSKTANSINLENEAMSSSSPRERPSSNSLHVEQITPGNEPPSLPEPVDEGEAEDLGMQHLSLKAERTPKSGSYQRAKEERQKEISARRAALEAAKDAYPLIPLSKAWDAKVRYAVNHGSDRFEASMFSRCVPEYSNDPRARSLWLDDAVINDYIAMVAKHGSKGDPSDKVPPSVTALSSFFFTKISSRNPNYASCDRMVRRAGITGNKLLSSEKVFIPINQHAHWTLAVIEPKLPEGATALERRRTITIYNSMGSYGNQQVAEDIMKWIQHELGASFKVEEWQVNSYGESPQQKNSDDCGVFTCTTARQIMLERYQDVNHRYKESAIRDMRKRLVAELVNGELLNKDESTS